MIVETVLQLTTATAAVGRIAVSSYRTSRLLSLLALSTVAADYAVKTALGGTAADIVGCAFYAVPCIRVSVLLIPNVERSRRLRVAICATAFGTWCAIALTADIARQASLSLTTIIPFIAAALAATGDVPNNQMVRRSFALVIGVLMTVFAIETEEWGLLIKTIVSDVAASSIFLSKEIILKPC